MTKRDCPLHKLFVKQQPKVHAKPGMGRMLTSFAEDDYKRIAQLIQAWLQKDEQRKSSTKQN